MENTFKTGYNPFDAYNKPEYIQLITELKQKKFRLSETGVNPRIFNQWKKAGLVDGVENDRKWVELDFGQYIWLKVIRDLRAFGVALEDIRFVKDKLTINVFEQMKLAIPEEKLNAFKKQFADLVAAAGQANGGLATALPNPEELLKESMQNNFSGPANQIELSVIQMLLSGKDASLTLLLNNDMESLGFNADKIEQRQQKEGTGKRKRALRQCLITCFIDSDEFENMEVDVEKVRKLYKAPHLKLPLRHYLNEFIAEEKNENRLEQLHLLRSDELALLRELRKENVISIEVIMERGNEAGNNRIKRFEIKKEEKKAEEARLIETFTSKEYAEIKYQVQDGRIVHFIKTTKIKMNHE